MLQLILKPGHQSQNSDSTIWPLFASIGCLWLSILILWLVSIYKNDGLLIYPLDDTYIHMAIAKNVVAHHVWGVTPYGFSWSTSSPLWTAMLAAAYWCFGVRIGTPLVLNAILATATCVFAWFVFSRRGGLARGPLLLAMLALIFLTSIPSLTMVGMEHVLQLLAVCAFIYLGAESLTGSSEEWPIALIAIAPLVSTARYEGLFLIVPAVCLFALRGRFAVASLIFIAAVAPVTGLGFWAIDHGWHFLPSSLIVKGNLPAHLSPTAAIFHFGSRLAINLLIAPWLLVLGIAGGFGFYRSLRLSGTIWTSPGVALAMYLVMLAADIALSRTGIEWYSRYDAYLVGSGVFIFACCWNEPCFESIAAMFQSRDGSLGARLAIFAIAVALLSRAVLVTISVPTGSNILYRQQYQLARLLNEYYGGQSVALNDIGIAAYMSDVRITDLAGLATVAAADAIRANQFDLLSIERICSAADVKIAIVYRRLFAQGSPQGWIEVGSAGVLKSASVGGPKFVFYGVGEEQANLLRAHLDEFKRDLPPSSQTSAADAGPVRAASLAAGLELEGFEHLQNSGRQLRVERLPLLRHRF
jgi:hypothetical protein